MKRKYTVIFIFIMIMLFIPMLQQILKVVTIDDLNGSYTEYKQPKFTYAAWKDGKFQEEEENYINQNFGFRNLFVRLNNQLYYTFFKEAKANSVIVGKNNYLFEVKYIEAYLGKDFLGKEAIEQKIKKLSAINEFLKSKGKDLIFVTAAGKGSYYPEYIPDRYYKRIKKIEGKTNLEIYNKLFKKYNINNIDFNQWFCDMKDTSSHTLFPKTGTHWSMYGSAIAADSLIRYIEKLRNIKLNHIVLSDIEKSNIPKQKDNDIEKGMNLIFPIRNTELSYPKISFTNTGTSNEKVMVVSDSYFMHMYFQGVSENAFNDGDFLYYFKRLHRGGKQITEPINLDYELANHDVFIIMSTEATRPSCDWNFTNDFYAKFIDSELTEKEKKELEIQDYITSIRATKKWYSQVKRQAKMMNIPLDSALRMNARYMIYVNNKQKK